LGLAEVSHWVIIAPGTSALIDRLIYVAQPADVAAIKRQWREPSIFPMDVTDGSGMQCKPA
jgi:hypothetical protein